MKKIIAFLVIVTILMGMTVFAEDTAAYSEQTVLLAFTAQATYESDSIVVKLSEISGDNVSGFTYNTETDFICTETGLNRLFIKELDSNLAFDGTDLILTVVNGQELSKPYHFKAFVYMEKQDAALYADAIGENTAVLAEGILELRDGMADITILQIGTSSTINNGVSDFKLENNLLLVNRSNTLERSYTPADLVYGKPSRGRSTVNLRLQQAAMRQLNHMLEAAYSDGVSGMVVTSGFRTFDKQTSLYNNKTALLSRRMNRKTAAEEASKIVAIPGSSEHQTGLAADICSDRVGVVREFANTKQGRWLSDNSWKFGFVIRYQEEKKGLTGIIYEPWHVRYVGNGHSEIMKRKNLCLEEYVDYIRNNGIISFEDSSGASYIVKYINKADFAADGMSVSLPDSTWALSNCTKDSYIMTIKL